MSATNVFENALLSLIFENADLTGMGDGAGLQGSSTAGVFYISLHTASPTDTGDPSSSLATYTSYAAVSVARSTAGWSVASGVADNDAAITFPAATGGSDTVTHFGISNEVGSPGVLYLWGALSASLAVSSGITPEFAAGALDVTLD